MSIEKKLYRKSGSVNSGKEFTTQVWWVTLGPNTDQFTAHAGRLDGAITTKVTTVKSKNIGKANETTPEQQALIEATAKWQHKVQRDLYKIDLKDGKEPLYLEPMLALDASKYPHRINWGKATYVTQPKLNGVRVTAHKGLEGTVTLTSREGMLYDVAHIQKALETIMFRGHVYDGELDLGNEYELGDVTRALKPKADNHSKLGFHVFDMVHPTLPFFERHTYLQNQYFPQSGIELIPNAFCESWEEINTQHDAHVAAGYEGIIIRDCESLYDYGAKNVGMFKYKKFQDEEFVIADVVADKDGTGGLFRLVTDNATLTDHPFPHKITEPMFTCRAKGTNAQRAHVLNHSEEYIGKLLTVRFSQKLKSGVPEFNRGITKDGHIAVRDYE